MKQFTLLSLFLLFTCTIAAQEVVEVQQTLLTKRTATWCPYCGDWGWDFFEALIDDNEEKAVLIAAHFGGSMLENPASLDIVGNFGFAGQPKFFINNEISPVSSNSTITNRVVIRDFVDAAYETPPLANTGMEASLDGNELTVATKTKFFQDGAGEYYLSVFLVEDDVFEYQAGIGTEVDHKKILQASLTANTFGEQLNTDPVDAGTEFDHTFTGSVEGYDAEQLTIVSVIWEKDGATYYVVNTWETDEISTTPTSVAEVSKDVSVQVQPNPATNGMANLQLSTKQKQDVSVRIYNLLGNSLATVFQGSLAEGRHSFPLEVPTGKGVYLVVVQTEDGATMSKRLIIQ